MRSDDIHLNSVHGLQIKRILSHLAEELHAGDMTHGLKS